MIIFNKEMPKEIEEIYYKIKDEIRSLNLIMISTHKKCSAEQSSDNTYKIYLNIDLPEDYFWEVLLHEHIHILQYKNGYRDLISTDSITGVLNNVIMDIDVHYRLKNDYHFVYSSNYGEESAIKGIQKHLEMCSGSDAKYHLQIVVMSVLYLTLVYNKEKGDIIVESLSSVNDKFKELYESFYSLIVNNLETNSNSISYVLREGAKIFEISNYRLR